MKITDEWIACGTCVESCPVGAIVETSKTIRNNIKMHGLSGLC